VCQYVPTSIGEHTIHSKAHRNRVVSSQQMIYNPTRTRHGCPHSPVGEAGNLVSVWYGMVWYGMVWYGMVWYNIGMVWYDMVYGMAVFT